MIEDKNTQPENQNSTLFVLSERKRKLGAISRVAILGLPIFLSLSRVFKEWAVELVKPYRMITPIYVLGMLIIFLKYRRTLFEIIFQKLTQNISLEEDEHRTVNEIKNRKHRIDTIPWTQRNAWLGVGVIASVLVDAFLWTLARQIDKPITLSILFAVFAAVVLGTVYLRREHFTSREKKVLELINF